MRAQEERDEQTLHITSVLFGALVLWPIPFLAVLAVAAANPLAPVPGYLILFTVYVVAVLVGLRSRGRR